jgi:gas vesicle protein
MRRNNGSILNEEEYSLRRDRRGSSKLVPFTLGAIVGGIIGATIALLYAPAEGSDVRQGVKNTQEDLTEGAKDIIRGAKSTAEKIMNEVLDSEEEAEDELPHVKRTRERADDIMEDADRAIAEARRRSRSRED